MPEMEWAGSSGRFDQGPEFHPHLTFPAQDSKVQTLCGSFLSNLREEGHGAFLRAGAIFMKRQHHLYSCVSGLGDLPQTGFWIRLHWISIWNLVLTVSFLFYCASACSAFCLPRLVTSLSGVCVLSEPVAFCSKQIPIKQLLRFWVCLGLPDPATLGIVVH